MEKITSVVALREKISTLELKRISNEAELKAEFEKTYEQLKPANLISQGIKSIAASNQFKETALSAIVSLAAGYFSKKVLVGKSDNPLKLILGQLLQVGVTTGIIKNSDAIISSVSDFIKTFSNKTQSTKNKEE